MIMTLCLCLCLSFYIYSLIGANQVQQRGIPATREILLKLLEGMNDHQGQKVLVVDMISSRWLVVKQNR